MLASYGHIRDLPPRNGSVDPDRGFALKWEPSRGALGRLAEIEGALMRASQAGSSPGNALVLATDPDREGEAISWHLVEELRVRGERERESVCVCV